LKYSFYIALEESKVKTKSKRFHFWQKNEYILVKLFRHECKHAQL
jgi:hypothetical protein